MPKHFYPIFIVSLLVSFLIFSGWSAFKASTPGTEVTDRDYYSKGLKYNNTMVEKRAASVLGWKIKSVLSERILTISLVDGKGEPVQGASSQLSLNNSNHLTLVLAEESPGQYHTLLPESLSGEISVRVNFEREGASINRRLLLNI